MHFINSEMLPSLDHGLKVGYQMGISLTLTHIGHLSFGEDGGGKDIVKSNPGFEPEITENSDTWGLNDIKYKEEII